MGGGRDRPRRPAQAHGASCAPAAQRRTRMERVARERQLSAALHVWEREIDDARRCGLPQPRGPSPECSAPARVTKNRSHRPRPACSSRARFTKNRSRLPRLPSCRPRPSLRCRSPAQHLRRIAERGSSGCAAGQVAEIEPLSLERRTCRTSQAPPSRSAARPARADLRIRCVRPDDCRRKPQPCASVFDASEAEGPVSEADDGAQRP